jgi:transcriptional regulator with XRE-family HTH domain
MTTAGRNATTDRELARGRALGAKLRRGRERKELTQQQVAEQAGLAYATVRKIEAGTPNPGFFTVADLARVSGVPLQDLARRPGRPSRQ